MFQVGKRLTDFEYQPHFITMITKLILQNKNAIKLDNGMPVVTQTFKCFL